MSHPTDEAIAKAVQDGKIQHFSLLIERYEAKMTRYARKFLFGTEDVQDLVQDTFIKAFVNIRSFDTSKRFSSWLYRIAHNEFVNALKKKGREKLISFDFDVVFPHLTARETADEDANRNDTRRMLDAYLDQLDTKYREPLVLYYFEELDYREIADILQIPVSTVGVRLRRGKERLQKMVSNNEHPL